MDKNDAKTVYADIINLPAHRSADRKHMSLHDRAAQFAPFAALSGYDDMVKDTAMRHFVFKDDERLGYDPDSMNAP